VTSVIVDRRPDKGKSTANRQRVLKRLDSALKAQVDKLIARKKLKEHDAAVEVSVERKDVKEPSFGLDPATGAVGRVVPGNEHYRVGDKIPRDPCAAARAAAQDPARATANPMTRTRSASRCPARNTCRCCSTSSNCRRY
jgi:uncharacterized sporulation protein YeaH/YhbH (DUF444 family)